MFSCKVDIIICAHGNWIKLKCLHLLKKRADWLLICNCPVNGDKLWPHDYNISSDTYVHYMHFASHNHSINETPANLYKGDMLVCMAYIV